MNIHHHSKYKKVVTILTGILLSTSIIYYVEVVHTSIALFIILYAQL